jgi:hypothetical protein
MNQQTMWMAKALKIDPMLYSAIDSINKSTPSAIIGKIFIWFCVFGCICEFIAYLCGFPNR